MCTKLVLTTHQNKVNTLNSSSSNKKGGSKSSKTNNSSSKKHQQNQAELLISGGTVQKRTARLNIFLCNFQLHYYNSWKLSSGKQPTATSTMSASPSTMAATTNEANSATNKSNSGGLNSVLGFFTGSNKKTTTSLENQMSTSSANNLNNNTASSDYNFTEDLMQLFSVVNIRIQKVR